MHYFIFTDLEKWKAINERPFNENTVTKRLLEIRQDTSSDAESDVYAVRLTDGQLAKTSKYLTQEEAIEFQAGMTETLEPEWDDWEPIE